MAGLELDGVETSWRIVLADGSELSGGSSSALAVDRIADEADCGDRVFAIEVTNTGDRTVFLSELVPFEAVMPLDAWRDGWVLRHGCVSPGDPVAWASLADEWRSPEADRFTVEKDSGIEIVSETLAGLARPDGSGALFAFTTVDRQATRLHFAVDADAGTLSVRARCILGHVELAPGEALRSETLVVMPAEDLWKAQVEWAERLARRYGAMTIGGSRVGWSDWQYYRREVTQADAEENLAALGERDFGVEYVLVDDGYQANMSDWLVPNDRWPGGADGFAAKVRAAGLSPGLWIAPLTCSEHGSLAKEHPEWLVKGADGSPLENGSHMGIVYAIDYTVPEAVEWAESLVRTIVDGWGVKWLKLDGPILRYYDGARFADPKATPVEVIRKALEAIKKAAGEAVIEGEGYYGPSIGMVHTQRVTQDIQTDWPRLRHATYTNLMSAFYEGRLWSNNPDAFILRDTPSPHCYWDKEEPVLSGDELEHEITALAMSGGVVMLTDRMATLDDQRAELVRAFVPPYARAAEPVSFIPGPWSPALWRLPVATACEDDWWVIAAFNWSDEAIPFELDLAEATGAEGDLHVFDYWQRRYLGCAKRVADGVVRPHGVRLVAARRPAGRPQLVGTDVHFTQGGVEIESMKWNEGAHRLTVAENSPVRSRGRLFFHVPEGFGLAAGDGPDGMVLDGPSPSGILTASYRASGEAKLVLDFARD